MNNNWISNEFKSINLGDQRLNKRLFTICQRFTDAPMSPINQSCSGWAETKAAYRFFNNDKVDYQKILKSHQIATVERAIDSSMVLAIQDTTYPNYTSHPKTKGLCLLSKKAGKNKKNIECQGLIMHSTVAATTDGLMLGIIDQNIYSRPTLSEDLKKLKKRSHNIALNTEEKDSYRWIQALKHTANAFKKRSQDIVTVCDREGDMYDLFASAKELKTNFLVRAGQNRKINKKSPCSEITGSKLRDIINKEKSKGTIEVKVPKKKETPGRLAQCKVKFMKFKLNPPRHNFSRKSKLLFCMDVYAIQVKEIYSKKINNPIEWILLSSIPVTNLEEAVEKINWYCIRWRIETWHKILKSGLQIEECRLSTASRLIRYLSIMSIVAWRIFWITLLARTNPSQSCLVLINEVEWKALYRKFYKSKKIPKKPPSINQVVRWIAQLGGFLARKGDKDPGIIYIWRGLKYFSIIIETATMLTDLYG